MDFKLQLTIPIEDILKSVLSKYKGVMLTEDSITAMREDTISALNTIFEPEDTQQEEPTNENSLSIMS